MKRRIAIALAAGALAAPIAALAQVVVVPPGPPAPLVYSAPAPQAGVSYYCSNPSGWYPSVQTCSAQWVAYTQPQPVIQVAPAAIPPAQPGVTWWCDRPQGWYPSIQRCSGTWVAYQQPTYVIAGTSTPSYVVVSPPASPASDPASAVYYRGPYRNAPYQSGIFP
jgi:hypothetical protein